MADPFTIDPDTLTLGEYAAIEEVTGWDYPRIFTALSGEGVTSPRFLLALQLVAGARETPGYTLEDAAQVRFLDLNREDDGGGT